MAENQLNRRVTIRCTDGGRVYLSAIFNGLRNEKKIIHQLRFPTFFKKMVLQNGVLKYF